MTEAACCGCWCHDGPYPGGHTDQVPSPGHPKLDGVDPEIKDAYGLLWMIARCWDIAIDNKRRLQWSTFYQEAAITNEREMP